jgi:hypothetical protein
MDAIANDYCEKTIQHIENIRAHNPDEEELLNDPQRSFFMLKNSFGPFKSTYSEALLQYVLMINQLKNGGKFSI